MIPVKFPEANIAEATKPKDWKDEDCASIPVWFGERALPSGLMVPCFVSYWKPSPEELADLVAGGGVYLSIIAKGLPPASLFTKNPFINAHTNGKEG